MTGLVTSPLPPPLVTSRMKPIYLVWGQNVGPFLLGGHFPTLFISDLMLSCGTYGCVSYDWPRVVLLSFPLVINHMIHIHRFHMLSCKGKGVFGCLVPLLMGWDLFCITTPHTRAMGPLDVRILRFCTPRILGKTPLPV